MLEVVQPVRFEKVADAGRTGPAILSAIRSDGSSVDLYVKLAAGCDDREVHLAMEVIAAALAADLQLPVMTPYLVNLDPAFISTVTDQAWAHKARNSGPLAFGSTYAGPGFSRWTSSSRLPAEAIEVGLGIFVFDCLIENPDRFEGNPNCLIRGSEIRIIDHEAAFSNRLLLPSLRNVPWMVGGLQDMVTIGRHIFRKEWHHRNIDLAKIHDLWVSLSNDRVAEYDSAIPAPWRSKAAPIDHAVSTIKAARDNIDACLTEVERALKWR